MVRDHPTTLWLQLSGSERQDVDLEAAGSNPATFAGAPTLEGRASSCHLRQPQLRPDQSRPAVIRPRARSFTGNTSAVVPLAWSGAIPIVCAAFEKATAVLVPRPLGKVIKNNEPRHRLSTRKQSRLLQHRPHRSLA